MYCPYCGPPFVLGPNHGQPASPETMMRVMAAAMKYDKTLNWELCAHGFGARAVYNKMVLREMGNR